MTLKLYTFRGRFSGRLYYSTGHTVYQAARQLSVQFKDLILERSEQIPAQTRQEDYHIVFREPLAG